MLRFSGTPFFEEAVGSKPARCNRQAKGKPFRLSVVEVTGLEPSSLPSLFQRRRGFHCAAALSRSVAPLPKNLASLRFSGTPFFEEAVGSKPAGYNRQAKGKPFRLSVVEVTGLEPTTSWSLTKRATKLRYTSFFIFSADRRPLPQTVSEKQHNILYMIL